MSEIIIPSNEKEEKNQQLEIVVTEEDELKFLLMYHMHFQPSEVDKLSTQRMQLILAQFSAIKKFERDQYESAMLAKKLAHTKHGFNA